MCTELAPGEEIDEKNAIYNRLIGIFPTVAPMALHLLSAVHHSNNHTNNMPAHFQVDMWGWGWVGGRVGGWGGSKGITVIESLGGGRSLRTSSRGIPDIKRGTQGIRSRDHSMQSEIIIQNATCKDSLVMVPMRYLAHYTIATPTATATTTTTTTSVTTTATTTTVTTTALPISRCLATDRRCLGHSSRHVIPG